MSDTPQTHYHYPNKMGRIIILATEEILGRNGLNAVLNTAHLSHLINNYPPNNFDMQFAFEDLSRIQATLEQLYGPRGGQGLALRTGRVCFKYGLREFGSLMGLTDLAFRLLPLNEKIRVGADRCADLFTRFSDQRMRVEENEEHFLCHIERCPLCWGRKSSTPSCHLTVGVLQEALFWVSGGKHFCIEETACVAMGDPACTIVINKQPLE